MPIFAFTEMLAGIDWEAEMRKPAHIVWMPNPFLERERQATVIHYRAGALFRTDWEFICIVPSNGVSDCDWIVPGTGE